MEPFAVGSTVRRAAGSAEQASCLTIALSLPDFFTREAVEGAMRLDLARHETFVAEREGQIVGFLVARRKSQALAEILWLAVSEAFQRQGIGSMLMMTFLASCRRQGVRLIEVKTLAPLANGDNYQPTRAFYEAHHFECLEIIDPFPGWMPGNPCAIYVRTVDMPQQEARH
ncbi:ribosomal protein S18 acetylase RimI-like enzyme [Thermosporothrix hazakensis]|jgi:ribosomal protein S18 acetylase RimI-like enzyme|uniref:Ribosomal protein S18 acetylase RimI-like enzyme n=2 Tax=Thermosporothrix TaxID=768650 RepID=A0A326UHU1_THEHA|nr:GNAT family N-acetyltransferase [Thermosporothrix hazakensis]PZW27510.1 ribosomal protein S18 acetylase RimI-like enzyme [Thermosporothrix hazakensis]BBH85898.1 hypothetical protein KTC_06490 [Thermosporothrix sp. COM3]GCE45676.1 hypothetical protein KTH_05450 [Thermosporothrix hazakensis]